MAVKTPNLRRAFNEYNKKYFDGELPAAYLEWRIYKEMKPYYAFLSRTVADPSEFVIAIHPRWKSHPRLWKWGLLHEMCHLKLALLPPSKYRRYGDKDPDHGPDFQKEMQRLALAGAFERLW
jgi:hypothetical protein